MITIEVHEGDTVECNTIQEAEEAILDMLGYGNLPSSVFDEKSGKVYGCRWSVTLEQLN